MKMLSNHMSHFGQQTYKALLRASTERTFNVLYVQEVLTKLYSKELKWVKTPWTYSTKKMRNRSKKRRSPFVIK